MVLNRAYTHEVYQIAYCTINGFIAQRMYDTDTGWTSWEHMNAPLLQDESLRTHMHWMNKPVYRRCISLGHGPAKGQSKTVHFTIEGIHAVISCDIFSPAYSENNVSGILLPAIINDAAWDGYVISATNYIKIKAGASWDMSSDEFYAIIEYVVN